MTVSSHNGLSPSSSHIDPEVSTLRDPTPWRPKYHSCYCLHGLTLLHMPPEATTGPWHRSAYISLLFDWPLSLMRGCHWLHKNSARMRYAHRPEAEVEHRPCSWWSCSVVTKEHGPKAGSDRTVSLTLKRRAPATQLKPPEATKAGCCAPAR